MTAAATARRTYPSEIADALRARILSGGLHPGDLLPPERELAVALGTNRATLREALRLLEAQGLVQPRQGQGVRVEDFRARGELTLLADYFRHAPADEQMRVLGDLMRLRSVVAREAVVWAAQVADAAELDVLDACVDELARSERGRRGTVMEPELALYRAIVYAGKSLAGMWLFNSLERAIRRFGETYPGLWLTPAGFVEAWQDIAAAIRARDSRKAERLIDALLAATDREVLDRLGTSRRPSAPGRRSR